MTQTRRQFFKTLAATAASVVAVGVAPRVVGKKRVPFKLNPIQETIISKSGQQVMKGHLYVWISHKEDWDIVPYGV